MKDKSILITGGGGFIGSHLAQRLCLDNRVTLLDLDFDNNSFAFTNLNDSTNIKTIQANLMDIDKLREITREAQIVIHAAAIIGVRRVLHNTVWTIDTNYITTSNLLRVFSQQENCECFTLFSTSEIYGSNCFRIAEEGDSQFPSIQDPRWSYSIGKLAAEHLAFGYYREMGFPVAIIRPFNVFGPGRIGDYAILQFILKAISNAELEVYGDGAQVRSWCYIDDFCDAILLSLESKEAVGQAFNIGNPQNTITIYELAKKVVSLSNSASSIIFKPLDFRDIDVRVPNITKAREILGYNPGTGIDQGLSQTIAWVKRNYEWLRSR